MWKDQYLMTNVLSYSYIFIGKTFFHRIIGFPSQPIVRVKPRTEIRKNISKYFSDDKVEVLRGAAIAPWIRLCLPSCPPGFESQAHHLHFFSIYIVQICPLNWNVKRICNSVSNNFSETWIRWSNVALTRLQSLYIYHCAHWQAMNVLSIVSELCLCQVASTAAKISWNQFPQFVLRRQGHNNNNYNNYNNNNNNNNNKTMSASDIVKQ